MGPCDLLSWFSFWSSWSALVRHDLLCCGFCLHVTCFDLHSGSWLAIFLGALPSGRLDVSWYLFGLLRIALICFLPVFLDLPGLYLGCCDLPWISASWLLRSALDLYSIVVLICAALFCVLVFRRDPISPALFSFC